MLPTGAITCSRSAGAVTCSEPVAEVVVFIILLGAVLLVATVIAAVLLAAALRFQQAKNADLRRRMATDDIVRQTQSQALWITGELARSAHARVPVRNDSSRSFS